MNTDQTIDEGCRYDLTIASVFQNEAPYLKEWIEFHKMMGVQLFILVDDRSTDNFIDVLRPYIDAGEVDLLRSPCPKKWQGRAWPTYQCALVRMFCEQLRGVSRWLALIDVDEFIVPAETNNIFDFLSNHEDCGGIYIRWEPFGTSHVKKLSEKELLTERLYLKWKLIKGHDMLGKSIVKPHRVLHPNIHHCALLPGYEYMDSNPGMENESPRIKLHHYWTRDEYFLLNEKLPRTSRIKGWKLDEERIEFFRHLFNDVPDQSMKRFIPELKRRVFSMR
jgi:Glycosyltransferase family 92